MTSEASPPSNHEVPRGLPPVTPPSGKFVAQLFLVPGLIIAVAVFVVMGLGYLVSGSRSTDNFLRELDSSNADIRWRGAHDLAQVLKRPESLALASDPKFALDIAERLRKGLVELDSAEKATAARIAGQSPEEQEKAWRGLAAQRNHVLYLAACLGDFTVPIGVPLLSEMALKDQGPEIKGMTLRRRRAVWALANLGENFKRRYQGIDAQPGDKILTDAQKESIVAELRKETTVLGERAAWANNALSYVVKRKPTDSIKPIGMVGADKTLEQCAKANDPYLRSLVALALNFWDGPGVEDTLLGLAHDDGHGSRIEINEND